MKNSTLNTRLIIILAFCCLLSILLACKSKKNSDCDAYGKEINNKVIKGELKLSYFAVDNDKFFHYYE